MNDLPLLRAGFLAMARAARPKTLFPSLDDSRLAAHIDRLVDGRLLAESVTMIPQRQPRLDPLIVIATDSAHPLDGTPEGLIHTALGASTSPEVFKLLLAAVQTEASERGWDLLRARVPTADPALEALLQSEGWECTTVRVRKALDQPSPLAFRTSQFWIQPAGRRERALIVDWIADAMAAGLCHRERTRISMTTVATKARAFVEELDNVDAVVLIATEDSRPVGHATAVLDVPDDVTGRCEAVLYDVFVVPTAAGRGIGAALTNAVERAVRLGGRQFLNGTVAGSRDNMDRLLGALATLGWKAFETEFVVPVSSQPGPCEESPDGIA